MGVGDAIARLAASHVHVLVVEVPHHWRLRTEVERHVLARNWVLATSPADADVMAVCGEPGKQLSEALAMVWHQLPGPRVRLDVRTDDDISSRLDQAHAALLDSGLHRQDARNRPAAADLLGGQDHDSMDHDSMDHDSMDHDGHGSMEMSPGGIPLAEGGEDRDGLEMDVLHLPLGPILAHWPAGLVLRCALQGDVIVEAEAEVLDQPGGHQPTKHQDAEPALVAARRCDNIATLLALAGWDDAAAQARIIRDEVLTLPPTAGGSSSVEGLAKLHRKVRRSRLLRWSPRGVGSFGSDQIEHQGLPAEAAGDTYDRLLRMFERAHRDLSGDQPGHPDPVLLSPSRLPTLVTGLDLATARLVIASLDLHELTSEHANHEMAHG